MAAAAIQVRVTAPATPDVRVAKAVLVIEDEPFVSKVTCNVLVEHGYSVLWARSVDEARRILARYGEQIGAMVCDAVLPDGSGIELAQSCRLDSPSLKLVIASGYPPAMLPQTLAEDAEAAWLRKPYSAAALIASLRNGLPIQSASGRVA